MKAVAGDADDSLDHVKSGFGRRKKNNDIAVVYLAVRKNGAEPLRPRCELFAIYEYVVADQQRVLHRAGRNLKGLHDKGNDEEASYQYCCERCEELNRRFARFFRDLRIFFLSHYFLSRNGRYRP